MTISINVEYKAPWWQGYIEFQGEKHYPTPSKHLEKFLYNCVRTMAGPLKDKIFALATKLVPAAKP